ncbi:conserved hypothetical protein [Perkinsus marinus ATCC 50983]|uniref:Cysteine-rich transmembrane CYSTM domain-containing protein n=1 Tax=Perkinsus marinus (strain ATCC 50983 / TXsc) TaxID=423536 RepID=C5L4C8_PERM5|nr:conserved hypothetical protein [Perkinsus marinus ATCC 50983]EER08365.1 conserved hypothetical protein [Perkinsus marinus ATCC 50983]|eukprot:XP_002776549.1 conserved hypothetical protein [Perkinsus marinus ATCC 50983]
MAVITVQVPSGASPGSTIQIVDPGTGTPLQVQVPQGVYSGQTFQVQTPGATGAAPTYSPPPSNIPYADGNTSYGGYNTGSQPPPYAQPYNAPPQQVIYTTSSPNHGKNSDDTCCAFLLGACACCTLCCLLDD